MLPAKIPGLHPRKLIGCVWELLHTGLDTQRSAMTSFAPWVPLIFLVLLTHFQLWLMQPIGRSTRSWASRKLGALHPEPDPIVEEAVQAPSSLLQHFFYLWKPPCHESQLIVFLGPIFPHGCWKQLDYFLVRNRDLLAWYLLFSVLTMTFFASSYICFLLINLGCRQFAQTCLSGGIHHLPA